MHPNDRKILKRALASLSPTRKASLEGILLEDADPASKNQNEPDHYYGLPPKGIQASLREDRGSIPQAKKAVEDLARLMVREVGGTVSIVDAHVADRGPAYGDVTYVTAEVAVPNLPSMSPGESGAIAVELAVLPEEANFHFTYILAPFYLKKLTDRVRELSVRGDDLEEAFKKAAKSIRKLPSLLAPFLEREALRRNSSALSSDAGKVASPMGKPVRLTPKEIARADYEIPDKPFTIVVRPQADGTYWVAAINLNTGHPLLGWGNENLGQMYVESKMEIPDAVRSIGRDLHKFTGYATNMTDQMRHLHYKGVQASGKTAVYRYGAEADLIDDALPPRAQSLYTKLVTEGKLRSNLMRELKEAMLATAATLPIDQRRAALAVEEMLNPENYQ